MSMDDDGCQNHDHEVCLGLGLGVGFTPKRDSPAKNKRVVFLDLSFPLKDHENARGCNNNGIKEDDDEYGGDPTNCSNGLSRKKLRLTADQTTLLEDSFRNHTTLNTAQKMTLAEKLNLKPRQVEVWFQNRRARTKLKQIEEEYEMVKKTSERLREENRRLKKELLEARSSSSAAAAAIRFLECGKSKLVLEKLGVHRGGGKKAAGGVEVVHGGIGGLPKPNHEEQQTLGFVGEGKLKGA